MIDYADVVQKFHCEHLSSWASRVKLHSSTFVLQELICSHGGNTWRERNTNIRGDFESGKKQLYLRGSEMVKEPSCENNWNLQLEECTVWADAKYESSTCVRWKDRIYSALQVNMRTWYLTNDWLSWCSSENPLWTVIILCELGQFTLLYFSLGRAYMLPWMQHVKGKKY